MPVILNIDTALDAASVCVAEGDQPIAFAENLAVNQHATWVHNAITEVLEEAGLQLADIEAVAVSMGPGSYTGLRIGLSTAKGLCYALQKPLIGINTLTIMASAVRDLAEDFICPMIDARRMEVFTALYDKSLNTIQPPEALVLHDNIFEDVLATQKILFTGNGMLKFRNMINLSNAKFVEYKFSVHNMLPLSAEMFACKEFEDLAYAEPQYIKAVHTT